MIKMLTWSFETACQFETAAMWFAAAAMMLGSQNANAPLWDIGDPMLRGALLGAGAIGWMSVAIAGLLIPERELARRPLYCGALAGFWAVPTMTAAHLGLAVIGTLLTLEVARTYRSPANVIAFPGSRHLHAAAA